MQLPREENDDPKRQWTDYTEVERISLFRYRDKEGELSSA